MTRKEFNLAVIALENCPSALREYAIADNEKIDKRNATRAAKPTKAQLENEALYPSVLAILNSDEPTLSTVVASTLNISTSKATGLLGNLFKEGKVVKVDVAVKGKGKQKGWLIAD
jgi:uncharacterized membrane protein